MRLKRTNPQRLTEFLKEQEGFSAYAYEAPEGNKTIGYGHVMGQLSYVTETLAEKLLALDIWQAEQRAQSYISAMYGADTWNTLPERHQQALTELAFNVGSLAKFPNFTRALVHGDIPTAIAESKRYYRDKDGQWRELKRRNQAFVKAFLT